MKKLFFFAVAAIGLFAGCTKNEVAPVQDNPQITFQAVRGNMATKALLSGTAYDIGDPSFGSTAFQHTGNWGDSQMSTPVAYINEKEVKWQNSIPAWSTDDVYYWPLTGNLTFFSYSPYTMNGSVTINATDGVKIANWNVAENQGVDVMVADLAANHVKASGLTKYEYEAKEASGDVEGYERGNYNGVPTVFRHKLSQIAGFRIRTKTDYAATENAFKTEVLIKSIDIKRIKQIGTYTSGVVENASTANKAGQFTNEKWDIGGGESPSLFDYNLYTSTNSDGQLIDNDFDNTNATGVVNEFTITRGLPTNNGVSTGITTDAADKNYLLVLPQTFTKAGKTTGIVESDKYDDTKDAYIIVSYDVRQYYDATNFVKTSKTGKAYLRDIHTASYDYNQNGPGQNTNKDGDDLDGWKMNKKITYELVIDLFDGDSRILWAPSIQDWESETLGEVTLN